MPTIRLEHVAKMYKGNGRRTAALLDLDFQVNQGEFVFLVGSRGAGKSTLLDIISGAVEPDRGAVYLDNVNLARAPRWTSAKMRRCMGVVRQESSLIRTITIYRNLAAPRNVGPLRNRITEKPRISKALSLVGMPNCEDRYPLEFSIPECRKIELAKAILHSPQILLLDELTERMDDDTVWDLMHLLGEMNRRGTTVIMATHASQYVNLMRRRVVTLVDGKIIGDVQKGRYGYIV